MSYVLILFLIVTSGKCSLTKLFRSFLLGYASGSFTRGLDVVIITFIYMLFLFFKEYKNINDKGDTIIWTIKIQVAQFELGCRIFVILPYFSDTEATWN